MATTTQRIKAEEVMEELDRKSVMHLQQKLAEIPGLEMAAGLLGAAEVILNAAYEQLRDWNFLQRDED